MRWENRFGVTCDEEGLVSREQYLAFGAPSYGEAEIEAIVRIMRSGWLGFGQETLQFEMELQEYLGVPEVVALNSCTSALYLALRESGVSVGDEVIVPSLTWCSSANAALYLGASPVFCDIEADTLCLSTRTVLERVTPRTRAVVVVHFGGAAVDVVELRKALPPEVAIIEDAAHALGARYPNGHFVGSAGNLTCFSFYANKNLATGEGGALALFDPGLAERFRRLRMHGMESSAWARYIKPTSMAPAALEELGFKMNYTDLQASIGRVQLRRFPEMQRHRHQLALRYQALLRRNHPWLKLQSGCVDIAHAKHLLVGLFDPMQTGMPRDVLLHELRNRNIGASIHYAPLHRMPLYHTTPQPPLTVTDALAEQVMTLPMSARMSLEDVDAVCAELARVLGARA